MSTDFDPSMLEMLQSELNVQLPEFAAGFGGEPAARAAMIRAAHSMRGAARIVGADALGELAGQIEKFLENLKSAPLPAKSLELLRTLYDELQQFASIPADDAARWLASREDEINSWAARIGMPPVSSGDQATIVSSPRTIPEAAESIEPIDPGMFEMFQTEVSQHAEELNSGLLELESNPHSLGRIPALMRAAHSMKGAARIVGIEPAVGLAHAMEDYFVAVQNGRQSVHDAVIDPLLESVDLLKQLAAENAEACTAWLAANAARFDALARSIATLSAAPAASVPPSPPPPADSVPVEESLDPSMLEMFRTEVEGYVTLLNDGLLQVENGSATSEHLQSLMRAAHSIKGASRIVGVEAGVELAHAMEDCLVAAQKGQMPLNRVPADALLSAVDFFAKFGEATADPAEATRWLAANRAAMSALASQLEQATRNGGVSANSASSDPTPTTAPPSSASIGGSTQITETARALQAADAATRAVRVTAENLNRILGLAGESLIETRWHARFQQSLSQIKQNQNRLMTRLRGLRQKLEETGSDDAAGTTLNEIERCAQEASRMLAERLTEFDRFAYRADTLSQRLYREAVSSRMRPFEDGVQGFPRLVRDVARKLGKKVRLVIEGKSTEVDRDILEKLEAPLNHLVRNALDHGCELPAERARAGKDEASTLRIDARHRAGMLHVSVIDDGRGVNLDRLKDKILERKLAAPEMVARMSEAELLEFLFLPGFSTKAEVTEISGRGVGLDVVQSMVHQSGGSVRVMTKPGEGTTFLMQLPITRSVLRVLLVKIDGDPYAFPLSRVDRLQSVPSENVKTLEGRQFVHDDDGALGVVRAAQVLGLKSKTARTGGTLHIVVGSDRSNRYGWVVDGFLGECELVLRPLDPRLGKVPAVSAAAILDDGTPVIILDVEDMIRSTDGVLRGDVMDVVGANLSGARQSAKRRILVVDDSFTVRETERKLLERAGFEVKTAVDGMDGWNAVRSSTFDLIVSDVDMPRMNGIELVRRIKQDARLQKLPVIIVSYKDREEDRLRGMEAGANSYLTKGSFQDKSFLDTIHELLGAAVP